MISTLDGPNGQAELIAFAVAIGMRQEWLQKPGTHHEHFDIFGSRRAKAIAAGCKEISREQFVSILRAKHIYYLQIELREARVVIESLQNQLRQCREK